MTEPEYGTSTKVNAWEDIRVSVNAAKKGASPPGDITLIGNIVVYGFDAANVEDVQFAMQMPHSYKLGSTIYPHVHWCPTDANAGNVSWGLEYTWIDINSTFGDTAIVSGASSTGSTDNKHILTSLTAISGAGISTVSSMVLCRLFRDADSTYNTDDYASDAALLEFDFHFEMDTIGSRKELSKT